MKRTLVIGASPRSQRYSHMAIRTLLHAGHPTFAVGLIPGKVESVEIQTNQPMIENLDTVTLYVGPQNQPPIYDYLVKLKPKRVIFNPGTENPELYEILEKNNIEVEIACTLVMLNIGNY
jgi:uncharacterized protein